MDQLAFCSQPVFRPLLFNVDQRPLTSAEDEMLDP